MSQIDRLFFHEIAALSKHDLVMCKCRMYLYICVFVFLRQLYLYLCICVFLICISLPIRFAFVYLCISISPPIIFPKRRLSKQDLLICNRRSCRIKGWWTEVNSLSYHWSLGMMIIWREKCFLLKISKFNYVQMKDPLAHVRSKTDEWQAILGILLA